MAYKLDRDADAILPTHFMHINCLAQQMHKNTKAAQK
jgi:hypothetical protein